MSYGADLLPVTFAAGPVGRWSIERITPIRGETLPRATRLDMHEGPFTRGEESWVLHGITSNARYVERAEKLELDARSPRLGRSDATRAVLIPIQKSPAWWALAQDERRAVFEARSQHIAVSLPYLPRIARRLHHSRELGGPYDFLTWFEFAPEHAAAFDELLGTLRASEEWTYVESEVELRLARV